MMVCKNMEIWIAELPEASGHVQHGIRPVVVVSNDFANTHSPVVTVVPLTSNTHKGQLPTHVLMCCGCLRCRSVACCEQVMGLDKSCLRNRLGEVDAGFDRLALRHALAVQLDMMA